MVLAKPRQQRQQKRGRLTAASTCHRHHVTSRQGGGYCPALYGGGEPEALAPHCTQQPAWQAHGFYMCASKVSAWGISRVCGASEDDQLKHYLVDKWMSCGALKSSSSSVHKCASLPPSPLPCCPTGGAASAARTKCASLLLLPGLFSSLESPTRQRLCCSILPTKL